MLTVIRFISGEVQIADLTQSEDGQVTIMSNPCILETVIDKDGKVTANMFPDALFCQDRKVILNENSIMYTAQPSAEIAGHYNRKYNSGIITPPEKQIILG